MKKKIIPFLIAIGAAGVTLGACGNATQPAETTTTAETTITDATTTITEAETTTETQQTAAAVTYPITFEYAPSNTEDKWEITITGVQYLNTIPKYDDILTDEKGEIKPQEAGKKFVVLDIIAKNTGTKTQTLTTMPSVYESRKLIYDGQYEYSEDIITGAINEAGEVNGNDFLIDMSVDALSEKVGKIIFEVPAEVADSDKPLNYQAMNYQTHEKIFDITLR